MLSVLRPPPTPSRVRFGSTVVSGPGESGVRRCVTSVGYRDPRRGAIRRTRRRGGSLGRLVPVDDEADPFLGTIVLERYRVEVALGAGAFGSVYRGRHTVLEREVAIKVLHPHLVENAVHLERFRREALAASRLNHPNVVAVLDLGQTVDGKHVMVMDLAVGESLTKLLAAPLAPDRAVRLIAQLLRGLAHAHDAGLIHRDLKPDNVIVDASDTPRIVDFGIALLIVPDGRDRLTGDGMIVGTPQYMAPEQAKGRPIDHRVDLYALGVIFYEMLAGMAPFEGTPLEIAVAHIRTDPPPVSRRAPGVAVAPVLEAYMRRLMCRDRERRFATAEAALEMLDLMERDPAAAHAALGGADAPRALALITLGDPPG